MLNIFFKGEHNELASGLEVIKDVELAFSEIGIPNTDVAKILIKEIEQGEYIDTISFKDRFGYKLDMSCLSTGCKAALVVLMNPSKLVDLQECGWNARDEIIKNCKEGNILLEYDDVTFTLKDGDEWGIDVRVDNYRFTNINSLNKYVKDRDCNDSEDIELYEGMEVLV